MWRALDGLSRYIATPTVAKHRLFTWLDARICPDHQLIVIARDDDVTFGILHSRFHEAWSLRLGTWLGKGNDPRYTPTTTFETFPFPEGLSPDVPASDYADDPQAAAIAEATRRLVSLRDRWLNPPELVEWVDEPVPDYPRRPVARDEAAEKALKKRTLTNLYNARPQWLDKDGQVGTRHPASLDRRSGRCQAGESSGGRSDERPGPAHQLATRRRLLRHGSLRSGIGTAGQHRANGTALRKHRCFEDPIERMGWRRRSLFLEGEARDGPFRSTDRCGKAQGAGAACGDPEGCRTAVRTIRATRTQRTSDAGNWTCPPWTSTRRGRRRRSFRRRTMVHPSILPSLGFSVLERSGADGSPAVSHTGGPHPLPSHGCRKNPNEISIRSPSGDGSPEWRPARAVPVAGLRERDIREGFDRLHRADRASCDVRIGTSSGRGFRDHRTSW